MSREFTETWHLTDDLVAPWLRVADRAKRIDLRKGQMLYEQGDVNTHFWFLVKGEIKVSITRSDGEEIVVDVFGPTSLCGDGPAMDGKPRFTAGQATRDSSFLRFDARDLPSLFKLDTDLPLSLLQIGSAKLRVIAARFQFLGSSSVQHRIAETLSRLANNFEGHAHANGLVRTRLSHSKLAAMTGTTRVSVTRTLKRLRELGAIAVEPDGLIRILDVDKLQG